MERKKKENFFSSARVFLQILDFLHAKTHVDCAYRPKGCFFFCTSVSGPMACILNLSLATTVYFSVLKWCFRDSICFWGYQLISELVFDSLGPHLSLSSHITQQVSVLLSRLKFDYCTCILPVGLSVVFGPHLVSLWASISFSVPDTLLSTVMSCSQGTVSPLSS